MRWLLTLVGVVFFLGSLRYLRERAQPRTNSEPMSGSSYIFKGPDAQDKVVVVAKIANQTVDWVYEGLKEFVFPWLHLAMFY